MRFAHNDKNIRIQPSYSGERAKCPFCYGIVIAKCGDIYVHHWQHQQSCLCDSWHEPETLWHLKWKAKFPESWQEVIIEKYGKKHIADIRTPDGFVIEFQNSLISASTIAAREDFYNDMLWVVNAQGFKHHFHLESIVKTRLRELEIESKFDATSYGNSFDAEIKELEELIRKNETSSYSKSLEMNSTHRLLTRFQEILNSPEDLINKAISAWSAGGAVWDYDTREITDKVAIGNSGELKEIQDERNKLKEERKSRENFIKEISQFETVGVNGVNYKIIAYNRINKKDFAKVIAISKESRKTIFLEVISFESEYQFEQHKYRHEKFDLLFNPIEPLHTLQQRVSAIDLEDNSLLDRFNEVCALVKEQIQQSLNDTIDSVKNQIAILNAEMESLTNIYLNLEQEKSERTQKKDTDMYEFLAQVESEKNEKKSKIMKTKKGLYWFRWKHKRKSWEDANAPIYFDTGKDYLFLKLSNTLFQKVLIEDFLKEHLPINAY